MCTGVKNEKKRKTVSMVMNQSIRFGMYSTLHIILSKNTTLTILFLGSGLGAT